MSGELTTVGAAIANDATHGRATQSARSMYLMLGTSAPTDATTLATFAEVSTAGYARQVLTWAAPSGDPSTTSITAQVTFGPFSADPPNVTHCAEGSASSGTSGDLTWFWALDVAKDAASGESIQFASSTGLTTSID